MIDEWDTCFVVATFKNLTGVSFPNCVVETIWKILYFFPCIRPAMQMLLWHFIIKFNLFNICIIFVHLYIYLQSFLHAKEKPLSYHWQRNQFLLSSRKNLKSLSISSGTSSTSKTKMLTVYHSFIHSAWITRGLWGSCQEQNRNCLPANEKACSGWGYLPLLQCVQGVTRTLH